MSVLTQKGKNILPDVGKDDSDYDMTLGTSFDCPGTQNACEMNLFLAVIKNRKIKIVFEKLLSDTEK